MATIVLNNISLTTTEQETLSKAGIVGDTIVLGAQDTDIADKLYTTCRIGETQFCITTDDNTTHVVLNRDGKWNNIDDAGVIDILSRAHKAHIRALTTQISNAATRIAQWADRPTPEIYAMFNDMEDADVLHVLLDLANKHGLVHEAWILLLNIDK